MPTAGFYGMVVNAAGQDGVYVGSAGNPSANTASTASNGLEVVGAQGDRLFVGPADMHGVPVNPAGYHGVEVTYAGTYGVRVFSAGIVGVYANTTQANGEWGIDTPDKIYAGTALASNGPLMLVAQSGDGGSLETGDLVIVSGTGTRLGESESPMPLVRRVATSDRSVMGVVYRHLVAEEKVEEIERDGEVERQTRLDTRSTDGPVSSGDTLLVVVLGPMQVKAAPDASTITAGMRLTAAADGGVRPLQTRIVDGMIVSEGAPVIGTAMGPAQDGLVWVLVNPQ